jgi:acetyltransferase-like isoleucine patch superfamily enzyme
MGPIDQFLFDIRTKRTPFHEFIYDTIIRLRYLRLPFPKLFGSVFYVGHVAWLIVWRRFKQFVFFDPMLRYRCKKVGSGVYVETKFPLIMGHGSIYIGDRVGISGNVNLIASYKVNPDPTIVIGDDVYLGYGSALSSAERITIGNRVLIAHFVSIYDNNNHPIDPAARGRNESIGPEDICPVTIEDGAWIGANSVILKGVTIGHGSVVATGSVVSCNVPPMTVVAGNPARVVKKIPAKSKDAE